MKPAKWNELVNREKLIDLKNRVTQNRPMFIMLVSVITLFALIFAYKLFGNFMMKKSMRAGKIPTASVSAMKVEFTSWLPQTKAVGSLRAINGVDVTTEVGGLVSKINFKPGANVKAQDLLVELNAATDLALLQSLKATAELAKTVYDRDKAQFAIQAVSKAVLDTDAANLKSKNADVASQEALIAKKKISAPFSGRLGISQVNLGQFVNPGDKMVTLQTLNPIYVDFYIPQQLVSILNINQKVTISSDSYPGKIFTGKITTINPKIEVDTRNIQIEATVQNSEYKLLPGMYASVEINTGEPQKYLTLPQSAISYNPYGDLVYIIKEKEPDQNKNKNKNTEKELIAEERFVTLGETRGDQVAIISGLSEGDMVVTSGQLKLKNNSPVMINNTVTPSNNPNPRLKEE